MGFSFRLATRVLLYASSHRQDSTYHDLCYTSRGSLAGTRNSSMGPPHEGSIWWPIAPWANALTTELHLATMLLIMYCVHCSVIHLLFLFTNEFYFWNKYMAHKIKPTLFRLLVWPFKPKSLLPNLPHFSLICLEVHTHTSQKITIKRLNIL